MSKKSRFIEFGELSDDSWIVVNRRSGTKLAVITWYPRWKKYVIKPEPSTIFDAGCLEDIVFFLKSCARIRAKRERD